MQQSRLLWILLIALSYGAHAQGQTSPCTDWTAWETVSASHASTLHAVADCQLPTPGHKVELVPATNQGSDKGVLVLNEVIHAPEGMVAQVITPYKLHYRRRLRLKYSDVMIQPSGTKVHIEDKPKKPADNSQAK